MKKYYEAYDERYRQVHSSGIAWASDQATPIVEQVIERFGIQKTDRLLEIGCGEGRDAVYLLDRRYGLLATDISEEAIAWCKKKNPEFAEHFRRLDCLKDRLEGNFSFIYAVAVLHMLVEDEDRARFYRFFYEQLKDGGIGLICTMGDGTMECASDIGEAFELRRRTHQETGNTMDIAATSCRMVSWEYFEKELKDSGLKILEQGMTRALPDFSDLLYAVVKIKSDRCE